MSRRVSVSEWKERYRQFELGFHWCTNCEQFLNLCNFTKNKTLPLGYSSHCKSCRSKRYFDGNHNLRKRRQRNYNRELKAYYKKLLGAKCAKCGYSKTQMALDFHHINPIDKEYNLDRLISTNNHSRIILEVDKCILLCKNCHSELEATCWVSEFEKLPIGWTIKEGSIIENKTEYWTTPSDKILYDQSSFLK